MIMLRELTQEIVLDIKLSECTVKVKTPGPFEGSYTLMKYFHKLMDKNLSNDIISDEIYDYKPVKDITEHATRITAPNYHNADLEKLADPYSY